MANDDAVYNPFNLCLFEPDEEGVYSAWQYVRGKQGHVVETEPPSKIKEAFGGISNHPYSAPYLKTTVGIEKFKTIVQEKQGASQSALLEALEDLMRNETCHFPDPQLERQGNLGPVVKPKSSIFIDIPKPAYGTRTQTYFLVDHEMNATFLEKTRPDDNDVNGQWHEREFKFKVGPKCD